MAEIPIEKKSGGLPWWLWLVLAAVIIALLVWLFAGDDRDENRATPVAAPIAATAPATTGPASDVVAGPITDLNTLLTSDTEALVGREVRLTNVTAGSVPTDAGFWITGDNGQREYVVLNEKRTPNTPIEGEVDVNNGSHVDIVGTVRSADEGAPEGAAIPGPTAPLPTGISHYIEAQTVTKTA